MRILAPLRDRGFALLCTGLALSAVGDQLYQVAISWVGVGLLGSNAAYLSAVQAGTVLVTTLATGATMDSRDDRRVMLAADLGRALTLVVLVAGWEMASGLNALGLVITVLCLSAGQALFGPALYVVLPSLVKEQNHLIAANSLLDATERVARLLGPGLIALIASLLPVMHFFSLDAASFVASALAVWHLGRGRPRPRGDGPRGSALAVIRRGVRASSRDPVLGYSFWIAGLIYGAWFAAFFFALPLVVIDHDVHGFGGAQLGAYGLIIACYGSTNLLSTIIVGNGDMPTRPARSIFGGNLITGAGLCLLPIISWSAVPHDWLLPFYCVAAALSAIGGPMKDVPLSTLRQLLIPAADLGASMRATFASSCAGLLASMLIMPSLCKLMGADFVMLVCGLTFVGMGVVGWLRFADRAAGINLTPHSSMS